MNKVSASALDLMASALAAIMLLYIITLQEILLFEKSVQDKSFFLIHLSLNKEEKGTCKIGVFLEKNNDSFFPHNRSDHAMIQPTHFGEHDYKMQIAVQNGKPRYDRIVVALHTCDKSPLKMQRLSIDILGAIATPRFQVTLSPKDVWMVLDITKIRAGQTTGAWLSYR